MIAVDEENEVGTAYVKDLLRQIDQLTRKPNSITKEVAWWQTPKPSPANSATSNPSLYLYINSITRSEQQVSAHFLLSFISLFFFFESI